MHITDKMPHNFLYVGLIRLILPKAKIIHCTRDPMDTCLSVYKNYFEAQGSHKYAYEMTELGHYYRLYDDLMTHWENVLPDFLYEIRYEDLVSAPEPHIRDLLKFCDLPWHNSCLEFHKTKRKVTTASNAQVRKPIYTDSVQKWKSYESQLQPLFEAIYGSYS